jgi:hypothetical protein
MNSLAIPGILYKTTATGHLAMLARFLCPHCHASLDPEAMDTGACGRIELRICPACDMPVVLDQPDTQVPSMIIDDEVLRSEPLEEFE